MNSAAPRFASRLAFLIAVPKIMSDQFGKLRGESASRHHRITPRCSSGRQCLGIDVGAESHKSNGRPRQPLVAQQGFRCHEFTGRKIHEDDTGMPLLDHGQGQRGIPGHEHSMPQRGAVPVTLDVKIRSRLSKIPVGSATPGTGTALSCGMFIVYNNYIL